MKKFVKHLGLVNKHRFEVFKLCCKCGLFWRGLTHDLSKYSPTEFWESVKYFSGDHSPIVESRRVNGYSLAWIHHKNRNKHHLEYWFDRENAQQMIIPYKYVVESLCDKIAATKCYKKKEYKPYMVLDYYNRVDCHIPANPKIHSFFKTVLTDLANNGEKYVLNKKYLKQKYNEIVLEKN